MYNKILECSDELITETQKASVLLNYVLDREENPPEVFIPLTFVKNSLQKIDKLSWCIQDTVHKNFL